MAFASDTPAAGPWSSLPPALLVMPELLLARDGDRHFLSLCAIAGPGVDVTVLNDPDCIALMARFIKERPELWHEDIAAP